MANRLKTHRGLFGMLTGTASTDFCRLKRSTMRCTQQTVAVQPRGSWRFLWSAWFSSTLQMDATWTTTNRLNNESRLLGTCFGRFGRKLGFLFLRPRDAQVGLRQRTRGRAYRSRGLFDTRGTLALFALFTSYRQRVHGTKFGFFFVHGIFARGRTKLGGVRVRCTEGQNETNRNGAIERKRTEQELQILDIVEGRQPGAGCAAARSATE